MFFSKAKVKIFLKIDEFVRGIFTENILQKKAEYILITIV